MYILIVYLHVLSNTVHTYLWRGVAFEPKKKCVEVRKTRKGIVKVSLGGKMHGSSIKVSENEAIEPTIHQLLYPSTWLQILRSSAETGYGSSFIWVSMDPLEIRGFSDL